MPSTSVVPFDQLSTRAQMARLRVCAVTALRDYPLSVARLRVINHGYNTTFRVDTADGRTFALRINVNSRKTPADLRAELAWLTALAAETDLSIPTPLPTADGRRTTDVWCESLGRALPATLFLWLPGPDVERSARPVHLVALGRAMATLHSHAQNWSLPVDATLPLSDDLWMHGTNYLDVPHPLLTAERRAVIDEAVAHVQPRYEAVYASGRPQVLHGDLHLGNVKWYRGRLSVFDFDDCVIGVPTQDLAVSSYYIRPVDGLEDALFKGYSQLRPVPETAKDRFEALVAGRNILLLNELFGTQTADFRDALPTYVANSVLKLRAYMDSGVYRHDVPGVQPLW
jgi:Ser/Thr protein kinase RdoA (MazF antagonist)